MYTKLAKIDKITSRSQYLLLLYRTQGAEGSQPAMKTQGNEDMNKMYKIKDVNVRMNVMYNKCACYYHVL
jgi:hypothetical protein